MLHWYNCINVYIMFVVESITYRPGSGGKFDLVEGGSSQTVVCQVVDSMQEDRLEFAWFHNSQEITNTPRRYSVLSETGIASTLNITYGDRDLDAGTFDCEVRNITIGAETRAAGDTTSNLARDNSNEANIICKSRVCTTLI